MHDFFSFYDYFCRILINRKRRYDMEREEVLVIASQAKRAWLAVVDIVLFATLTMFFLFLLTMSFAFVFPEWAAESSGANIGFLMLREALLLVGALLAACVVLRIRKFSFSRLGLTLKGWGRSLAGAALLVVLLYAAGFGLSLLSGAVEVSGFMFSPVSLLLTLLFFFLVAVAEEVISRGFVLGRLLDEGINKYVALLVSATLFSLMHLFNPDFAFIPFMNIILAGCFLGVSYLYTRNLCFSIALHWFWNWIQGPVLGYKVSGNEFIEDTLLMLRLPEENLLNGGGFGFEGSILCSCLLILGTVVIIRYYSKRHR